MQFGVQASEFPQTGCAVVFGGTGGLGQAIAGLLGQRGSNVLITYHSRAKLAQQLAETINEGGGRAAAIQCNVTDPASVEAVIDTALRDFGSVHSVISAGGLEFGVGPLAEVSAQAFKAVVDADIFGFFNIAQASVPALRKAGGGSITALVTCAVARNLPNDALSAVPKAAVATMTKQIATEEGQYGIRANCVGPGLINAGIGVSMVEQAASIMEQVKQMTPLRRVGLGGEFAEAVVFLASARAGFVTGQMLMADGGLSA